METSGGSTATTSAATTTTGPALANPDAGTLPTPTAPGSTASPTVPPATGGPGRPDLGVARARLTKLAETDEPIAIAWRAGDPVAYLALRGGQVRRLTDDGLGDEALDLTGRTKAGGERGLLGMAFAPDGRHLYVHYTDRNGTTTLDELTVRADGGIDGGSRRTLLTQEQPYPNHNGGELTFGPDGMLYLGLGDGGSGGDPDRHALDLTSWLGKILRIDPQPDADRPYTVPPDNPFVGRDGTRQEIWSYGLRNPWRFSFDAPTGDLWIGDVGQNEVEEVNVARANDGAGRGRSFGWSAFEGTRRFNQDQRSDDAVVPFHEYEHGALGCSVTGGAVYRGTAIPALRGAYVFADYCASGLRAFDASGTGAATSVALTDEPGEVVTISAGPDGELYVLSLGGGVFRLDPA